MSSYPAVVDRWVDIIMGRTTKANLRNPRMFGQGDSMFSYGMHFELGRVLRDRKRQPRMFLLNGDRFSVTTTRHQNEMRNAVGKLGYPVTIIPFSALGAAGIDLDTVEMIDETGDRWETTHHESYEKPPRAVWDEVPVYEYRSELTADELAAKLAKRNAKNLEEWEMHKGWADDETKEGEGNVGYYSKWLAENPAPKVTTFEDLSHWERRIDRVIGTNKVLRSAPNSQFFIDYEDLPDGRTRYSWDTSRHWLGEAVIRAMVPRSSTQTAGASWTTTSRDRKRRTRACRRCSPSARSTSGIG